MGTLRGAVDDDEKLPEWVVKYGAPLAITFYILVAVVKTMLTKAFFEGGAAFPMGFSAISAIATCTVLIPVFLIDRTQWAVPKRDYMPGFLLVCTLVALDLALTNIAVALLAVGICIQLAGVTCSACKYVFAHSVMQKCKKDLGTFAFLFWIDVLILFILVPWAVINGELIAIISDPETPM